MTKSVVLLYVIILIIIQLRSYRQMFIPFVRIHIINYMYAYTMEFLFEECMHFENMVHSYRHK